jgi:aspartyl protease family protein
MIGWALRWVMVWCGLAIVYIMIIDSGRRSPPLDTAKPEIVAGRATEAEAAPAPTRNTLVYPVDRRGHVVLDAVVNGASVRFLVDTGASLVTLNPADARAACLDPRQLAFDERANTANGIVRMASVTLREIRLGQMSISDVSAAVIENLSVSLLGMSFLNRLQSYEMRNGKLTITW